MRKFYRHTKGAMARKQVGWEEDEFRALLVDSTMYSPDFDKHKTLKDIESRAIIAVSEPLKNKVMKVDAGHADLVTFGQVWEGKVSAIVVFKNTGVVETSLLMHYSDEVEGFPFIANGSTVEVEFPNNQVFKI